MDYVDVQKQLDPTITPVEMENMRHQLGLDRPFHEQYIIWLVGKTDDPGASISDFVIGGGGYLVSVPFRLIQNLFNLDLIEETSYEPGFIFGNFGNSFSGTSVNSMIGALAWQTMKLQIASLLMSLLIGIPLGIFSARRPYSKIDSVSTTFALFGVSMPVFWTGVMAIMLFADMKIFFGIKFPTIGAYSYEEVSYIGNAFIDGIYDELFHMILPTLVLGFQGTALILRLTRSSMLEILRQDYILTARSKGLAERVVIYKHALRNALLPVVTVVGLSFGFLLAGAALTETVFAWPGLGKEAVFRVNLRDYNFMMGINMLIAIMVIISNLVTDVAYAFLDPRIRY
jgi:peptide/nickel transport system permease protein